MRKIVLIGSLEADNRKFLAPLVASYEIVVLPLDGAALRYLETVWPAAVFLHAAAPAELAPIGLPRLCAMAGEGLPLYVLLDSPAPEARRALDAAGAHVFFRPRTESDVLALLEDRMVNALNQPEAMESLLLVDSDVTELRRLRGLLSDYYRVTVVSSSLDALKFLEKRRPDLILLDYSMPVVSGTTLMSLLKSQEKYAHIPVFLLAGERSSPLVLECAKIGASGCLLKTASAGEMLAYFRAFRKTREERRRPCTIPLAR